VSSTRDSDKSKATTNDALPFPYWCLLLQYTSQQHERKGTHMFSAAVKSMCGPEIQIELIAYDMSVSVMYTLCTLYMCKMKICTQYQPKLTSDAHDWRKKQQGSAECITTDSQSSRFTSCSRATWSLRYAAVSTSFLRWMLLSVRMHLAWTATWMKEAQERFHSGRSLIRVCPQFHALKSTIQSCVNGQGSDGRLRRVNFGLRLKARNYEPKIVCVDVAYGAVCM